MPLTDRPEQECQIEATTFLFIKCFLEQTTLKSKLTLQTQYYNYTNAALKNAVRVERRVIRRFTLALIFLVIVFAYLYDHLKYNG